MNGVTAWSIGVEANVIVAEFPDGTSLTPADSRALMDRWEKLVALPATDTVVSVVRTSRPCSDAGREALRSSAVVGAANGVSRWAVVAEKPKREYLRRTVDVDGIDVVEGFNNDATAVAWATR